MINVTDNFNNLGRAQGSSTIMLNVDLTTKNELKCEILLNNHQYCVDTTRIQFQGTCMNNLICFSENIRNTSSFEWSSRMMATQYQESKLLSIFRVFVKGMERFYLPLHAHAKSNDIIINTQLTSS